MNESRKFFLKEKPVKALMVISEAENETYCSEISEKIDSTYAHTVKLIGRMEDLDLLRTRKSGRKKLVSLSNEGKKQADIFRTLLNYYESGGGGEGRELKEKDAFSK